MKTITHTPSFTTPMGKIKVLCQLFAWHGFSVAFCRILYCIECVEWKKNRKYSTYFRTLHKLSRGWNERLTTVSELVIGFVNDFWISSVWLFICFVFFLFHFILDYSMFSMWWIECVAFWFFFVHFRAPNGKTVAKWIDQNDWVIFSAYDFCANSCTVKIINKL